MSAATRVPAPAKTARQIRHRIWIGLGGGAGVVLCAAIAVWGASYYVLPAAGRIASQQHPHFKPSGTIGHPLGIAGIVLFAMMYVYALRKRWPWLSRKGKTKNWLDYHILMGLTAPVIITFHSSFKLQGIAGLAWWIMVAVAASGVIGRYLYGHLPRKLDAAEMTHDEAQQELEALTREIEAQSVLSTEELKPLLALPSREDVQKMPLLAALTALTRLDIQRFWLLRRIRRTAAAHVANNAELNRVFAVVRKQAALSRDIVFLAKMHQIFHLWHVVHRPFSYSFALLALLHVAVVMVLGFY